MTRMVSWMCAEPRTTAPVDRVPLTLLSGGRPGAPSYCLPNVITVRHWDRSRPP